MTKRNQKSVRVQCILILVNCYCWRSSLAMISLRTLGGLRYFFFCALSPYLMSFKGYVCIHIVHVLNLSIIRRILLSGLGHNHVNSETRDNQTF